MGTRVPPPWTGQVKPMPPPPPPSVSVPQADGDHGDDTLNLDLRVAQMAQTIARLTADLTHAESCNRALLAAVAELQGAIVAIKGPR